jgi:hypothetical protein
MVQPTIENLGKCVMTFSPISLRSARSRESRLLVERISAIGATCLVIVSCAVSDQVHAQSPFTPVVTVTPANPTSNDTITAVLFMPIGECSPIPTIARFGNHLTISQVLPPPPFNTTGTCGSRRFAIGTLDPGAYELEWVITGVAFPPVISTVSFVVSPGPSIQSLPISGFAVAWTSSLVLIIGGLLVARRS